MADDTHDVAKSDVMQRRTLPKKPWRGGQICGWQSAYGLPWSIFCGERKADNRFFCTVHDEEIRLEYGYLPPMAEGNAVGDRSLPVRLLWEPMDNNPAPVEADDQEITAWENSARA